MKSQRILTSALLLFGIFLIFFVFDKKNKEISNNENIVFSATINTNEKILFITEEEGMKMAYGNIVVRNNQNRDLVIGTFNSLSQSIERTFKFDDKKTSFSFIEVFSSGCCTLAIERLINLEDPSQSIAILSMKDTFEDYRKRNNIPKTDSYDETILNLKWIDQNSYTFERFFSTRIGDIYPTETWQYNVETGEYKLIETQ